MTSSGSARLDRRAFLIALGLVPAAAALASCGRDSTPKQPTGPDLSGADDAVRVQDDLYRHVNGKWLREYQLPPDKTSFGAISEANERTESQLREIVEGIKDPKDGTDAQKIRDLYDARVDWDTVEKLGMTPLQDLFDQIDKAATKPDLAKVMGALPIGGLIGLGVSIDSKHSDKYVPIVAQSGTGLGEEYYRKPQYAQKLAAYRPYLEKIAAGAGFADPAGMAQRVLDLETRIAAGMWDKVRNRDAEATYNRMTWAQLTELGRGFDWEPWLAGSTDRPKELFAELVVRQPSFITAAAQLWNEVDIAVWRDYLKIYLVRGYAKYLPKAINDANFDFFGTVMQGQQQRQERWRYGIDIVNGELPDLLGKLYVDKHFPASAKEEVKRMVDDLLTAYRENFRDNGWMSHPTRDAALTKLDKMRVKIGYPDKWDDYSKLTITRGKLIESLRAVNAFSSKKDMDRLGTPVDKSEWGMSPQTVNAYYSPPNNEIVFPAAYLQPPYFDKDATLAVNFGAVGATIGHEIGHGFDDQGSKYDADGNLKDWWTPEDRAAFEARAQKVVGQYDGLVPEGLTGEHKVDGKLTLGENLADLRGFQIALAAYRIAEKRAGNDNPDFQSVFLSWSRGWRSKQTPELTAELLSDPHSPDEFRCNQVVRNLTEFYNTFGVKEGDKLFLAQDQRVTF
ncbi:M13 family metallopeptidase [Nocardia seriolae]|uniref:Endothelin-converting protein n=1 Tax=Nocardia seriolae TaxID=37332 RepID=A0ABC8B4P4_9NOCA|nr:M13 family metallopeptidase [Nocardia seriolae]APB01613.1 Neprilysin [Nocardia seriolae]OJF78322.1 endothelin-converting protein [Nocardia seriolae]WNJ58488.1 M13 family metallopeptidase [Nocardia seriolae]BAW04222.1 endothelin-converting protein [Nocardia seriolae]GAM51093.1 endothelin-converting protein [Nocardia seriolae]